MSDEIDLGLDEGSRALLRQALALVYAERAGEAGTYGGQFVDIYDDAIHPVPGDFAEILEGFLGMGHLAYGDTLVTVDEDGVTRPVRMLYMTRSGRAIWAYATGDR
ncbi:hypothetical protein [Actinoalloteichus spitiensis]|uniref:hypothetical protein n=1 Tax=Actinoalloteichus spitiensis TaxID=252394 RepID=UPI0002DB0B9D|nr:hypothetical protein [Actinoalloteichus spitiensis]